MSPSLASLTSQALDLLYPPRCAHCDLDAADSPYPPLCHRCIPLIQPLPAPHCLICQAPLATPAHNTCTRCLLSPPPFSIARAAHLYQDPIASTLHRLKYSHATWIAPQLARSLLPWLLHRIAELAHSPNSTIHLIPIPSHPTTLRRRGFSPTTMLAHHLTKLANSFYQQDNSRTHTPYKVELCDTLLHRARQAPPQASLQDAAAREHNVADCFTCTPHRQAPHTAILFDDVITTGATASEAARTLLRHGAQHVELWAIARSSPHPCDTPVTSSRNKAP